MNKYSVRISKEYGGAYYTTTVEADNEKDAFLKARDEAQLKGIVLPSEVWTRIKEIKNRNQTT